MWPHGGFPLDANFRFVVPEEVLLQLNFITVNLMGGHLPLMIKDFGDMSHIQDFFWCMQLISVKQGMSRRKSDFITAFHTNSG